MLRANSIAFTPPGSSAPHPRESICRENNSENSRPSDPPFRMTDLSAGWPLSSLNKITAAATHESISPKRYALTIACMSAGISSTLATSSRSLSLRELFSSSKRPNSSKPVSNNRLASAPPYPAILVKPSRSTITEIATFKQAALSPTEEPSTAFTSSSTSDA